MTLYFVDGGDIPYVALSEYMPFLSGLFADLGKGDIAYEIVAAGEDDLYHFEVSRPDNGSMLFVFPERDQLMFSNYNTFTQTVGSKMMVSAKDMPEVDAMSPMEKADVLYAAVYGDDEDPATEEEAVAPEAGEGEAPTEDMPAEEAEMPAVPSLFTLKEGLYVNRAGDDITLNLADYLIDIVAVDGECCIPFQTMNDLLVIDDYMQYVFDGEKVIGGSYGCPVLDEMDSAPKYDMSEAFAMFNYDSPVKNIVLDLSNNGGGNADAAIFVISWFLGEADIALRDTFTGAQTNAMYLADVNLDGEFDEQDNVAEGYRLYCLTTNSSFSCGNLVPAACRSSGRVTLIGQPTGGGSCVVQPCTTAAGTLFQISGSKQISIIKNGSFYDTDQGVKPDFRLDKPESYYERPALVEYLHNLK